MRIIINGAGGRMGRTICAMIEQSEHTVAAAVDAFAQGEGIIPSLEDFSGEADCIIDFSNHAGTKALVDYAVARNLPLVIATTGQTEEEMAIVREGAKHIPLFNSGNMSLGIALLTELARQAAKAFPDADIEIVEQHHNQKLDVPSGTAIMLGRAIQQVRTTANLLIGRHENRKRTRQEIGIHSIRMGNTVGVHEVIINTGTQIITLKHEAQNRALFAEGALSAASFLIKQAPGFYCMDDIVHNG